MAILTKKDFPTHPELLPRYPAYLIYPAQDLGRGTPHKCNSWLWAKNIVNFKIIDFQVVPYV